MRRLARMAALLVVPLLAVPAAFALGSDDTGPTDQAITELQQKLQTAEPREQCFLYAELIHAMTEMSIQQYAQGHEVKANALLRQVQTLTRKLHLTVTENDKRLKNAEILLRRTAFRLTEMLHDSGYEDRKVLAETLAQVNQADNDAMMQVFKR
jgi:AraC-like DNA-binding protein